MRTPSSTECVSVIAVRKSQSQLATSDKEEENDCILGTPPSRQAKSCLE